MEEKLLEIYKENSGKPWPVVLKSIREEFPYISKHQLSAIINAAFCDNKISIMFFYIHD